MQKLFPLIESTINYTLFKGNILIKEHNTTMGWIMNQTEAYTKRTDLFRKHTTKKIKSLTYQCYINKYLTVALT